VDKKFIFFDEILLRNWWNILRFELAATFILSLIDI